MPMPKVATNRVKQVVNECACSLLAARLDQSDYKLKMGTLIHLMIFFNKKKVLGMLQPQPHSTTFSSLLGEFKTSLTLQCKME
jgi:hypothetical protein